jgi:hypothetical protein
MVVGAAGGEVGQEAGGEVGGEADEDPTAKLLRARRISGENSIAISKQEQIKKEMNMYEKNDGVVKLEGLETNGDRLKWWKKYEDALPRLSKLAMRFLGIPCSSSKSERVFSIGAMMVTKKRHRLSCKRAEGLIILHDNRKLVEDFYLNTSYKKGERNQHNAFLDVHQERDGQASDVFVENNVNSDDEITDDSDEEE